MAVPGQSLPVGLALDLAPGVLQTFYKYKTQSS